MIIIPAILPKTREELIEKLSLLRDAGFSGRIQIDMCDGNYVDSKTWPFANTLNNTFTSIELMAMIKNDSELQELLKKFTADTDLMVMDSPDKMMVWNAFSPDRIIIHLNSFNKNETLVALLNAADMVFDVIKRKAIIFAFSLDTDIEKFDYWYREFGFRNVQVMGIEHVGHQGQEFSDRTISYIANLKNRYADLEIIVDGGVSSDSIGELAKIGVTSCVVGSSVFRNNDILNNISELQERAIL